MERVVVVGTGGLAREFTEFFASQVEIVGYLGRDDEEYARYALPGTLFRDEADTGAIGTRSAVIAIGSPALRRKLHARMAGLGYRFPALVHGTSVVAGSVSLGAGAVVSPQCCIGANVELGEFAFLNFCCGIGHDARLGRYVQVNPGAQVGGFCSIGDDCLVGSNATIRQGLAVGAGTTVASGAVVLSRIREGTTVMGNPARRLRPMEGG